MNQNPKIGYFYPKKLFFREIFYKWKRSTQSIRESIKHCTYSEICFVIGNLPNSKHYLLTTRF